MQIQFTNKVVLITGGTRGIGKTLVQEFHQDGAIVYGTGTDKTQIERLNAEHQDESRLNYIHLDFTKPESVAQALKQVEALPQIDVLVNNAGVNKINPVDQLEEADWDWIHTINLKGVYQITQVVSKKMMTQNSGKISNIASIFGVVSKAQRAIYSTTKFGLIGYTKAAALDLAPYNVLVNAVSPGVVMTELTAKILSNEKDRKAITERIPLQRFAQPEEITKIILFLSSDYNTYITAQNIVIDGGFVSE